MPLKTRGKALAVPFSSKQQGIADYGPSALMRSLTSSSSSQALKTVELLASSPPIFESRDVALAESIAFTLQKAFAPLFLELLKPLKPLKLLAVLTLIKLKGRDNYKTWIYEI
jgi:hypothetical protein